MDGDDVDVDAMLEAPFMEDRQDEDGENKKVDSDTDDKKHRSRRSRSKDRKRSRSRSHDKKKKKKRSSRSRSRDRDRKKRRSSRSRSRDRDRRRDRKRRSRSPPARGGGYPPFGGGRGFGRMGGGGPGFRFGRKPRSVSKSPIREGTTQISKRDKFMPDVKFFDPVPPQEPDKETAKNDEMAPEERDQRTVFCMQLSPKIRVRDLEEFFTSVGQVRDVRIITDSKTGKSKGIAYIEFLEIASVTLALGLNGQKLLGYPINVQPTQAERNRLAAAQSSSASSLAALTASGKPDAFTTKNEPKKVYVGNLHPNITESMLQDIFEPFGKVVNVELIKDKMLGKSKGFGFVTFQIGDDAQKAIDQLNGFELAGNSMRVHHLAEGTSSASDESVMDDSERTGFNLGTTGRLQLMAKLAQGTGMQLPAHAQQALQAAAAASGLGLDQQQLLGLAAQLTGAGGGQPAQPNITTSCFLLSNMFDGRTASNMGEAWVASLRNYVVGECLKRGGAVHIYIDKGSEEGHVYVKSTSIPVATATVAALHGHTYLGRIVTAAYIPENNYHMLFPEAENSTTILTPQ